MRIDMSDTLTSELKRIVSGDDEKINEAALNAVRTAAQDVLMMRVQEADRGEATTNYFRRAADDFAALQAHREWLRSDAHWLRVFTAHALTRDMATGKIAADRALEALVRVKEIEITFPARSR